MTNQCKLFDAVNAYLDGEAGDKAAEIERHLTNCTTCRAYAQEIKRVDTALRTDITETKAPASLRARLEEKDERFTVPVHSRSSTRRRFMVGLGMAAGVGGIAIAATQLLTDPGRQEMAPTLFGDFATLLAADKRLDFDSTKPSEIFAWFKPKLPFSLPNLKALQDMGPQGGRLCWLMERRTAAFYCVSQGDSFCLYVTDAGALVVNKNAPLPLGKIPPVLIDHMGIRGAFWQTRGLAFAIVGQPSIEKISMLADGLREPA